MQSPPTLSVIISGYSFKILAPYTAGSVLTAAEAQALNALRAERIQTNTRSIVQRANATRVKSELLTAEQLTAIQSAISDYDSRFVFIERRESKPRLSALDREIEHIAVEQAKIASNLLRHTSTQFEDFVNHYRTAVWVQEEARRRIEEKAALILEDDPTALL